MARRVTAHRGEVWWAHLPDLGERPVLVVSADLLNLSLREVTVARITAVERERALRSYVRIEPGEAEGLPALSFVLCHNLYTVAAAALRRPVGELPEPRMVEVEGALRFALDL